MFTIPADATARDVVEALNAWANAATNIERRMLWYYLTALRGPDNDSLRLKDASTVWLRQPLNRLANQGGGCVGYPGGPDNLDPTSRACLRVLQTAHVSEDSTMSQIIEELRKVDSTSSFHFGAHVGMAVVAMRHMGFDL